MRGVGRPAVVRSGPGPPGADQTRGRDRTVAAVSARTASERGRDRDDTFLSRLNYAPRIYTSALGGRLCSNAEFGRERSPSERRLSRRAHRRPVFRAANARVARQRRACAAVPGRLALDAHEPSNPLLAGFSYRESHRRETASSRFSSKVIFAVTSGGRRSTGLDDRCIVDRCYTNTHVIPPIPAALVSPNTVGRFPLTGVGGWDTAFGTGRSVVR